MAPAMPKAMNRRRECVEFQSIRALAFSV